jgi:diguanylate cyclase
VIDFSYPVLDVLLIGAVIGVFGILGWRPDRVWILLGVGLLVMGAADAAFAIQQAHGIADGGHYDFVWTLGALLIAYAAWVRAPDVVNGGEAAVGLRVVALALLANALAIAIQIYAFFGEIGRSERIVTAAVLLVSSVQIVLARPRVERRSDHSLVQASSERKGAP